MLEFELDAVQQELDKGNFVTYASCFGGQEYCAANNPNPAERIRRATCVSCISRVDRGLDWLDARPGKFRKLEFKSLTEAQEARIQNLKQLVSVGSGSVQSVRDRLSRLEDICWRAAKSGLGSDLRDANPSLVEYRTRFALLLGQALESLFSMRNHIQQLDIDLVYIYNGRMPRYWPALRAVEEAKIPFKVYEFPLHGFNEPLFLENSRVHDREDFAKEMFDNFSALSDKERDKFRALANNWFLEARDGRRTGAQDIFLSSRLSHVESEKLPEGWPGPEQGTVTFFPSSQWEFAGSGSADEEPVDQVSVIRACLKEFSTVLFYVRVHPAQPDSDREFLRGLEELKHFPNCVVLPSSSPVDSVAIGIQSNLVVTFGSTVGVQLGWEGKRVIEYGSSFYSVFGANQNAQSLEKLFHAVRSSMSAAGRECEPSTSAQEGSVNAMAAQFAIGKTPKYLRKDSFYGGRLLRNGRYETIKPGVFPAFLELIETIAREPGRSASRLAQKLIRCLGRSPT